MTNFDDYCKKIDEQIEEGARLFKIHDEDLCMLCGAHGEDKKSLFINCWYNIKEAVPEVLDLSRVEEFKNRGYYLRICKSCRAELLVYLERWRNHMISRRGLPMDHDGNLEDFRDEANIPMRVFGGLKMMTEEEYNKEKGKC